MKWLAVLFVGVVAAVVAYRAAFPTYYHRYKLIAEVQHRGEMLREEGVIEIKWAQQPRMADAGLSNIVRGRGPIFDLGGDGILIFMIRPYVLVTDRRSIDSNILLLRSFGLIKDRNDINLTPEVLRAGSQLSGAAQIPSEWMPQIVWVPDPSNVSSARPIKSDALREISPSTALRSAAVEVTNQPLLSPLDPATAWVGQAVENDNRSTSLRSFLLAYRHIENTRDSSIAALLRLRAPGRHVDEDVRF